MNFDGKTALVTGATRGFGYEIALALGKAGAHVIAVGRTVGGLEELDDDIQSAGGSRPSLITMDLCDFSQIDPMGQSLYERFGKLDILVGNAAILPSLMPTSQQNPNDWQRCFDLNLTANMRLIRSLFPLLISSPAARAVFLTCAQAQETKAFWGTYAASKSALNQLIGSWAQEISHTTIRANLFDPGPMQTKLRRAAFPGEAKDSVPPASAKVAALLPLLADTYELNGQLIKA